MSTDNYQIMCSIHLLSILNRFYLRQSVYDFEPLLMMHTAIYFALKNEEYDYNLQLYVNNQQNLTLDTIPKMEPYLMKGLKFNFLVYSPYRCLDGFYNFMRHNLPNIDILDFAIILEDIRREATKFLKCLHHTD